MYKSQNPEWIGEILVETEITTKWNINDATHDNMNSVTLSDEINMNHTGAHLSATRPLSAAMRLYYERVYTVRDYSASEIYW